MTRRAPTRLIACALGLVALVAGWFLLGPTQLGGGTSYAAVVGNLMEPLLEGGDLALVRARASYRAGDVVLYDSPALGSKVLHRIVRVEGDRFVLKGDNNAFTDDERSTEAQIAGTLWLRVPLVGRVAGWLIEPRHAALLAGLATLLALGGGSVGGRRRRRETAAAAPATPNGPRRAPPDLRHVLAGLVAALAAFGVLAAVSFAKPASVTQTIDEAFVHEGRFEYDAVVPRNPVYPDGHVTTGEPVFLKLVSKLRVSFDYRLRSEQALRARGQVGLDARLSDGRGWERLLHLVPARPFEGRHVAVAGTLDLGRIQALTETMRDLTGSAQNVYSLTLLPQVSFSGRVGESPIDSTFAPALAFELADLRLQPSLDGTGAGLGPFAPREAGTGTRVARAELELGRLSLPVRTARVVSLTGLAAALLLGALLVGAARRRPHRDEHEWIQARHGHLLLPVSSRPPERRRVNELADVESLVRLAAQHGRLVIHVVEGGEHSYVVEEGDAVYRYRSGPQVAAQEEVSRPVELETAKR